MIEFALPDVGEGLTEAEILAWRVAVGDTVAINDTLVEVETAKSVVELPSPGAGVIAALHVSEGQTVDVGAVIVSIADAPAEVAPDATIPAAPAPFLDDDQPLVLVGTGPAKAAERRRRLGTRSSANAVTGAPASAGADQDRRVRTKPPVRLLAKQLGVDLSQVTTTTDGIVTREAVHRAASDLVHGTSFPSEAETRIPIKGVRKAIAEAMTTSAFTAPHVTEWLSVDVTRTMEMLARLKRDKGWSGIRLTPLVFVARALLLAVRRFPEINARWDEQAQEIVLTHPVNLGIAAATPRGLLVPNIKDADQLCLANLATAMEQLILTAREGRTPPADMQKGTITITNIGALGVDAGTPILNPGEAAILAFGSIREMPWVVGGHVLPRMVTQLAMSFDHRLVDGELGSNVLVEVGRLLSDPGETFLYV